MGIEKQFTEKESMFLDAAETLRRDLRDRRSQDLEKVSVFKRALSEAGTDMAAILEPATLDTLVAAAEPLKGLPVGARIDPLSYYAGSPPELVRQTEHKYFRGIFEDLEIIGAKNGQAASQTSALCMVINAFKKGRYGEFPYSTESRVSRRVSFTPPVDGCIWVPVIPMRNLELLTTHYDGAIQALADARKAVSSIYDVMPQKRFVPIDGIPDAGSAG